MTSSAHSRFDFASVAARYDFWYETDECRMVFAAVERAFEFCGAKTDIVLVFKVGNACPACAPDNKGK
jgi:Iap family predicted aminopeptidase